MQGFVLGFCWFGMIYGGGGFEETVKQMLILTSAGVGNYVADRIINSYSSFKIVTCFVNSSFLTVLNILSFEIVV